MTADDYLEDQGLVASARGGNEQAFEKLVSRYFGPVYAAAFARLGEREAAEEVAQESFLRAYLNLHRLGDGRVFCAWVLRISRNLALDWARRGQRVSGLMQTVGMDDLPGDLAGPADALPRAEAAAREESALLSEALQLLPVRQREVLLLHFVDDLSKSDIARLLHVHPSSVGRQIDGALAKLRQSLGPRFDGLRGSVKPSRDSRRRAAAIAAIALMSSRASEALAASAPLASVAAGAAVPARVSLLSIHYLLKSQAAYRLAVAGLVGVAIYPFVDGGWTWYQRRQAVMQQRDTLAQMGCAGEGLAPVVALEERVYPLTRVSADSAREAVAGHLTPRVGSVRAGRNPESLTVKDTQEAIQKVDKIIRDIDG